MYERTISSNQPNDGEKKYCIIAKKLFKAHLYNCKKSILNEFYDNYMIIKLKDAIYVLMKNRK